MCDARTVEADLPAELWAEPRAQDLLARALEGVGAPSRTRGELALVLEELFVNVARYAYPGGAGRVRVRVVADGSARRVELTLEDEGVPFDPLGRPEPDRPSSALEARVGGLGIPLVRGLSESVSYERADGRNRVRATLRWGARRDGGPDDAVR